MTAKTVYLTQIHFNLMYFKRIMSVTGHRHDFPFHHPVKVTAVLASKYLYRRHITSNQRHVDVPQYNCWCLPVFVHCFGNSLMIAVREAVGAVITANRQTEPTSSQLTNKLNNCRHSYQKTEILTGLRSITENDSPCVSR